MDLFVIKKANQGRVSEGPFCKFLTSPWRAAHEVGWAPRSRTVGARCARAARDPSSYAPSCATSRAGFETIPVDNKTLLRK